MIISFFKGAIAAFRRGLAWGRDPSLRPDVRAALNVTTAMPGDHYWRSQDRLWMDDTRITDKGVKIAVKQGWIERKNTHPWRIDPFVRATPRGRAVYRDVLATDPAEAERATKMRRSFLDPGSEVNNIVMAQVKGEPAEHGAY